MSPDNTLPLEEVKDVLREYLDLWVGVGSPRSVREHDPSLCRNDPPGRRVRSRQGIVKKTRIAVEKVALGAY